MGLSAYAYSEDGHSWTVSDTVPYTWTLHYEDGTATNLTKCERPKLFFSEDGQRPLFLLNGARSANPAGGRGTWTAIRPLSQQ